MPYACSHFYFDINFVDRFDIKVKVTTWIGHKSLLINTKLDSELSPVISPWQTQIHRGNSKLIDYVTSLIFCKNSSKRWSIALLLWYNLAQEEFKQVPSKRCAHCTPLYFSNKIFEDLQLLLYKNTCTYILHSQLDDQTVQLNYTLEISIHNSELIVMCLGYLLVF